MSVADFPSEAAKQGLRRIRVRGGVRLSFAGDAGRTYALHVHEADGHRVRFPAVGNQCEAVLINTGGGIAGGDDLRFDIGLSANAKATVTSVAAERIYRSDGNPSRVAVSIVLSEKSNLAWLPQETILYSGARFVRRIEADIAADAEVTLLDIVVFGRRGSGERMLSGLFDDRWSIRRSGRLIHMEAVRIEDDIDDWLRRPAVGAGAHVVGTLLHTSCDAADKIEAVRTALNRFDGLRAAASAWDGKLAVRALGERADHVRRALAAVAQVLTARPPPRVWAT